MADTCFRCHGPDKSSRMANLRLDLRDEALKPNRRGESPIVPGDPAKSLIVQRVFADSPARLMPPASAHKTLTPEQKDKIRRWVAEGAVYEGHWAYQPVKRPEVPKGYAHPIDAFVRTRLAQEGIAPAPPADPRTLLRRLYLDLTGLPPTPQQAKEFYENRNYEKVVDQLLASDRYAERQAMFWLDAVRYADTCGFHGDNPFPAWPYRDYVLQSIRDNKRFDIFTQEQLAGDLMPAPSTTQLVASAFNRMARTSSEGGLQPKEYLAKYGADRVRTVAGAWLGMTLGCAECHDHKFDPILQKDFYAMKAFFADIKETGLVPDQGPAAWGELLALPDDAQRDRWNQLNGRIADLQGRLEAARRGVDSRAWLDELRGKVKDWKVQVPVSATSRNGAKLEVFAAEPVLSVYDFKGSVISETKPGNGLVVASGPNPDNETYTLRLRPGAGTWYSLGLEVSFDDRLPGARLARGSDRLVVTEVAVAGAKFARARSNVSFWDQGLTPWNAIDGKPETGWGVATYRADRAMFLALDFEKPLATTATTELTVTVAHDSTYRRAVTGRFRVALAPTPNAQPSPEVGRELTIPGVRPAKEPDQSAVDTSHPDLAPLWEELSRAESGREVLRAAIPHVVTTISETDPPDTRVLGRGNFLDESGEIVAPAVPTFLGRIETGKRRATRLDLANWLVSPENPLTARVYVNRQWRRLFGAGLSRVLEDLGSQGDLPVHQELLDYLASGFMRDWDMKKLVRLIVTSETYKQSSQDPADGKDPENRFLARQVKSRVDAELVRDVVLSAAGLLAADKFGGPSVRPYQPEGYLAALNFPKRDYSESRGKDLYRRGVYTFWQRTFLHPSLMAFDGPSREECTLNRTTSNTPVQSLAMLNDPSFVEAARVFGERLMAAGGIAARVDQAFWRALSRPASDRESKVLLTLYQKELARYRAAPADAKAIIAVGEAPHIRVADEADLAATISVARAVLNVHELITRN